MNTRKTFPSLFLLLLCLGLCVRVAHCETVGLTSYVNGGTAPARFFVRVHNPTGAADVVRPATNGNHPGGNNTIGGGFTGGVQSLPAGGYVDMPYTVSVSTNSSPAGSTFSYNWTSAIPSGKIWKGNFVSQHAITFTNTTFNVLRSNTTGVTVTSPATGNIIVAEVYLSNPAPSGKITVVADAAAVGSRLLTGAGADLPITLALGSNVVFTTTTPADMPNGTTILVKQGTATIGSGVIAKDAFGNYDLTIAATGIPSKGELTITHNTEVVGTEVKVYAGSTLIDTYTALSATVNYSAEFVPHTQFADGTVITAKTTANGDEITLGSGTVQYGTGNSGGWVVSFTATGLQEQTPDQGELMAKLDLTAYDASGLTIGVRIDGGAVQPVDTLATGNAASGTRKLSVFTADNSTGQFDGKTLEWVVSGTIDGLPVSEKVVATALVPVARLITADPPVMDHTAALESFAIVGTQKGDPPPDSDFDPETASPEDKADYDKQRKAFEDALNGSGIKTPGLPSMDEGTAQGKAIGDAVGKIAGMGQIANQVGGVSVASLTGTNALSVTVPVLGSMVWDPADMEPATSLMRAVALMGLLWQYLKVSAEILRNSHV